MTCIAGLVHNRKVYMGCDSMSAIGYDLRLVPGQKVFRRDNFLIGGTGSARMLQVVRYEMTIPEYHPDVDVMQYMVSQFAEAFRNAMKTAGEAEKSNERESYSGLLMVGFRGRLFIIDSAYAVIEAADGYDAIGCGDSFARGSLFTSADDPVMRSDPVGRIETALRAAERMSIGVRGPFTVEVLDAN